MSDKWPLANGNWSNAANWNDGTKPQPGDNVYADGKTVTIDEDITVASLRTAARSGGTSGGQFAFSLALTINAEIIAGTTAGPTIVLNRTAGTGTAHINGSVTGGVGYSVRGLANNSSAEIVITGNVTAGQYNECHGVANLSTGTVRVIGNAIASPVAPGVGTPAAIYNASTGSIVLTGNCVGAEASSYCVDNYGAGVVTITGGVAASKFVAVRNRMSGSVTIVGNVAGGTMSSAYGVENASTGGVTISGNCSAGTGSSAHGAYNASTGRVDASGIAIGNGLGVGSTGIAVAYGVYNSNAAGVVTVGGAQHGSRGAIYAYGTVFFANRDAATVLVLEEDLETRTLVSPLSANNPPAATDVRSGVSYTTGGAMTGSLAVPLAAAVAAGVPVDATVGTAVLTADGVRAAVGLASANLDAQFAAISIDPQSIRDAMKLAPSAGAAATGSIDGKLNGTLNAITVLPTQDDLLAAIASLDWVARAILSGTVNVVTSNADFTLTGDDLSSTNNQYDKCWLVFITGNNKVVGRMIGVYTGSTKRVQFTGGGTRGAFPSDVVSGDQWYLMPNTDLVAGIVGVQAS